MSASSPPSLPRAFLNSLHPHLPTLPSPPGQIYQRLSNGSPSAPSPTNSRSSFHGVSFLLQIGLTRETVNLEATDLSLSAVKDLVCSIVDQKNVYYTSSQQLHLGVLSPTIDDDDNKCLVDVNSRPRLLECSYAATKHMKLTWTFTQGGAIQNIESQRCLELVESKQSEFTFQLAIQDCAGQKWTITNILTVLPQ